LLFFILILNFLPHVLETKKYKTNTSNYFLPAIHFMI